MVKNKLNINEKIEYCKRITRGISSSQIALGFGYRVIRTGDNKMSYGHLSHHYGDSRPIYIPKTWVGANYAYHVTIGMILQFELDDQPQVIGNRIITVSTPVLWADKYAMEILNR